MAFADDVVDLITAQVSHIGLSTDGVSEYAGGSYAAQVPSYAAASAGSADITATLNFDGTINDGPVTHYVLKKDAGATLWTFVALSDQTKSFNSDGKLDLTSASVSAS